MSLNSALMIEATLSRRQTITTRYYGPGNVRGSRITARSSGDTSLTIPVDNSKDVEESHKQACLNLMAKLEWSGSMVGGVSKNGMVWVFSD